MSKKRPSLPVGNFPVCRPTHEGHDPIEEIWTSGCGARGIRTPDILLAKQALYQLSYGPDKRELDDKRQRWDWEELNLRPHAYQACALTA